MQVKIVRETATVKHGALSRGEVFTEKEIDERTMQRWIKRKIAVEYDGDEYVSSDEAMKQLEIRPEDIAETEEQSKLREKFQSNAEPEIADMAFQELRRYAKENGYENYGKMNREELIELLSEDEEVAEEKSPFFDGVE